MYRDEWKWRKHIKTEEQTKPKTNRWEEIVKTGADINEIENIKTVGKNNKTKNSFFEKINKIDKYLARLTKKKKGKTQISNNRME